MSFTDFAVKLCGQSALLLGWRPHEFWAATPAELTCIANAVMAQSDAPPDSSDLQKLMAQFPDIPMEMTDG